MSRSLRHPRHQTVGQTLRWGVVLLFALQAIVGALPALAQGSSHAVASVNDEDKRMLLELVGDVVGERTVQLHLTATPTRDAPSLQVKWDVGDAQMVDGASEETLGAVAAYGSVQQARTVVLPGQGVYGLMVSVTYRPSPDRQYGAATMLWALVDAQGMVTLTRLDPNAVSPKGSMLQGTITEVAPDASIAELQETSDDPCVSVSGRVTREDRLNTQTGRQGPVTVPVRNAYIEIREEDIVFDDSYGESRTDANGNYSFSFCDDDGVFDDDLEVYIRLRAELFVGGFSVVEVTDSSYIDETYEWDSPLIETDGGSFGRDYHLTFDQSGVMNIADAVLDAWLFWNSSGGAEGDDDQFDDQAEVHWEPGYGDSGSYYNGDLDYNEITIADTAPDADQWDDSVIMHEWGHQADDNYGCDENPGGPHNLGQILSDPELAWGEAYPDYWQSAVRGGLGVTDGRFYFDANNAGANMLSIDMEGPPTSANQNVEDAIATMLWDLADSVNDAQDTTGVGHAALQRVYTDERFEDQGNCTVAEYLLAWRDLGLPTDAATAASVTQNIGLATPFSALAAASGGVEAASVQGADAVNVPPNVNDDYVWWQRVTMVADNSSSMAGSKFDAVKTVMQEQVNDVQDLPQGVEFGLYNFNNTQAGSQEVVRGRFFPEFILPAINGMTTTSGGVEPCAVNAFSALADAAVDKSNGEAWLYTDGDTTLGPGVEAMQQMLTTRGLQSSFVLLGGCSSPPDPQPQTIGAMYNFLGKAANSTQSQGIVPYLLTAIATGGNFLFVSEAQLPDAADILRAQLAHSAGAGSWSDYVSTGPTYTWDKLTSWEYEWITPVYPDHYKGQSLLDNDPLEIAVPPVTVYNSSFEKLRVYGDGYIQMGGIPTGPFVIPVYRYLKILYADLYWEPFPPAAAASAAANADAPDTPNAGNFQQIFAQESGDWVVITTQSENGSSPSNRAYQVLLNKNTGEIRYQYKTIPAGDAGNAVISVELYNSLTLDGTEVVVSNMDENGANPGTGYKFTPMPPQPTKTFTIPVDAQIGGVAFLMTGYSGTFAPLAVTDPNGNAVNCAAEGSLCLNLGLVQYVQTNVNGREGDWHAVVAPGASGEGTFSFFGMGASAIAVSSRLNHQLALGAPSKLAISLGGLAEGNQLTTWFQKPDGTMMGSPFMLLDDGANCDGSAGDGEFGLCAFMPPGEGVGYMWVRGVVNGTDLQRSDPVPYNFQPLDVTGPQQAAYLGSGELPIDYTMTNYGDTTYCYDHTEQLPDGWTGQWEFTLVEVINGFCLGPGESKTRTYKVTPTSLQDPAPSESFDELVVTFREEERGQIVDSAATAVVRFNPPARVVIENHLTSSYLRPNGTDSAPLLVGVLDAQGYPVVDGTQVDLSATLGSISPTVGSTINGLLPVVFTAGNAEGEATIQAKVAGAPTAETMIKIQAAYADRLAFEVDPTNLIEGSSANLMATVVDHWGDPVAGAIVRLGVEGDDGEYGGVVAASQASAAATLQMTDVVTLTTDGAGQVAAVFTKDPAATGRTGVRAELLFDEGDGLDVVLEERREIILSQSGLFTREIYLPITSKK